MIITAVAITPESGVSTLCRRFQHCSRQRCLHCYAPWFVLEIFIELLTLKIIIELLWFEFVLKCKPWLSGSRWIWTEWIYLKNLRKKQSDCLSWLLSIHTLTIFAHLHKDQKHALIQHWMMILSVMENCPVSSDFFLCAGKICHHT